MKKLVKVACLCAALMGFVLVADADECVRSSSGRIDGYCLTNPDGTKKCPKDMVIDCIGVVVAEEESE